MNKSDFNFELPKELIAQHPTKKRTNSRLLALDKVSGKTQDLNFPDIIKFLNKGDLLVFNNTKVIPATSGLTCNHSLCMVWSLIESVFTG